MIYGNRMLNHPLNHVRAPEPLVPPRLHIEFQNGSSPASPRAPLAYLGRPDGRTITEERLSGDHTGNRTGPAPGQYRTFRLFCQPARPPAAPTASGRRLRVGCVLQTELVQQRQQRGAPLSRKRVLAPPVQQLGGVGAQGRPIAGAALHGHRREAAHGHALVREERLADLCRARWPGNATAV